MVKNLLKSLLIISFLAEPISLMHDSSWDLLDGPTLLSHCRLASSMSKVNDPFRAGLPANGDDSPDDRLPNDERMSMAGDVIEGRDL